MNEDQYRDISGKIDDLGLRIRVIETALVGDVDGRRGIVHTVNDMRELMWGKPKGLVIRVEDMEARENQRENYKRGYMAAIVGLFSLLSGAIGWIIAIISKSS